MSATRARVRILHLSDLHERGDRETEEWRRRRVLGPAWEANLAEILQDGPIDLVCFTGDAANWGKTDEFAAAGQFLLALLDRLRVPKERLFVVPGNHDVDRGIHPDCWVKVREAAGKVDGLELARWLHGAAPPFGFDNEWREMIFSRLAAYRTWVRNTLGRPELIRDESIGGPHAYRQEIEIRGARIQVVGLDSAWLCGDDHDAGQLRVGDEQVMRHLSDKGEKLPGFRLVLMHHPIEELAVPDQGPVRRCLGDYADLVLRGHLHSPETALRTDPDRSLRHLAAGCLYEGGKADHYPNGCQVLTLDLVSEGRIGNAEVRFRSFSPRGGHYFDDDGIYSGSSHGRLRFAIGSPIPAASKVGIIRSLPPCPAAPILRPRNGASPPRAVARAGPRDLDRGRLAQRQILTTPYLGAEAWGGKLSFLTAKDPKELLSQSSSPESLANRLATLRTTPLTRSAPGRSLRLLHQSY